MLTQQDFDVIRAVVQRPIGEFREFNPDVGRIVRHSLTHAVNHGGVIDPFIDHTAAGLTKGQDGTGMNSFAWLLLRSGRKRSLLTTMRLANVVAVVVRCGYSATPWPFAFGKLTATDKRQIRTFESPIGDDEAMGRLLRAIDTDGYANVLYAHHNDYDWKIPGLIEWYTAHPFAEALYLGDEALRTGFAACFAAGTDEQTIRDDFRILFGSALFRRELATVYEEYVEYAPSQSSIAQRFRLLREAVTELIRPDYGLGID